MLLPRPLAVGLLFAAACSSSGGGAPDGGTPGRPVHFEGGSSLPSCEGVLADTAGATVHAIATDGTDAYIVTKGPSGERVISLAKGGQLTQLASVQSDDTFSSYTAGLAVDATAIYVDAVRGQDRPLVRVDRASGTQTVVGQIEPGGNRTHPLFVADDQYVYYEATISGPLNGAFVRLAKAGGNPEALGDLFYGQQGLDASLFQDSAYVYYVFNGGPETFRMSRVSKTAVPMPDGAGWGTDSVNYTVAACQDDPFRVAFDKGFFANCSSNGAWLYALPAPPAMPPGPGASNPTLNAPAVPMPSLTNIDNLAFYAAQGNLYLVADSPSGFDQELYRVPQAGGTPTPILATQIVDLMTASATTLFLNAPCGVQSVAF